MGAVAAFNYQSWTARYPEFDTITDPVATAYFAEATIYHANDGSGPVADAGQQLVLLNMLTAHVAALNLPPSGQTQSPPLVGRISDASEGSVSVSVQNDYPPGTVQWYQQTKYGSAYWAATAKYRTAQISFGQRRAFGVPLWGGGPWRP